MIGNSYLEVLYEYEDMDTSLNQLLEYIKFEDKYFIESIFDEPVYLDACDSEELFFLTVSSAIMDYFFQIKGLDIPEWIRDERLAFDTPYYYSKRLNDIKKVKLQFSNPAPFRRRNVYFELEGLQRV
ncbi:MAG: hypothetical protein JXQ26_07280 [Tissierellales bacterium]|nr:hypothetical protein [Tissierellales bacterium]MBN2827775.1 hypothetical protein [Tissierellales bacterium]